MSEPDTESAAYPSLRSRLLRHVLLPLGLVWLAGSVVVISVASHFTQAAYDRSLLDDAYSVANNVRANEAGLELMLSTREVRAVLFDQVESVYFAVRRADGSLLTGQAGLFMPDEPAEPDAPPFRFANISFQGKPLRAVRLQRSDPQAFEVVMAQTTQSRSALLRSLLLYSVIPEVLLLVLLAAWLGRAIRAELQPLARLQQALGQRNAQDLTPLQVQANTRDVHLLEDSLNALLARVARGVQAQLGFAGNVAHELRTPLATTQLRLQGLQDLIGQQPDAVLRQELQKAQDALAQLSRRAEKLLQMSRAESGATLAREPVALSPLAAAVAQEFWLDPALMDRLQLQVPEHGDAVALGDADALAIVLRNLLENAVRYAPHGPIVLRVALPARLSVSDQGLGMAPDRQAELLQRHQQGHADPGPPAPTAGARHPPQPGYGLGLSIVSTIVERQGGQISLHSPAPGRAAGPNPGLEVRLDLPPAPPPPPRPTGPRPEP